VDRYILKTMDFDVILHITWLITA